MQRKGRMMTNLAIDLVLFFCVLAFVIGSVLAKAKRWPMMMTCLSEEAEYWANLRGKRDVTPEEGPMFGRSR